MCEDKPLLKKIITIASAEKKVTSKGSEYFTIIDNNKLKFKVWKSKQDGTNTKAWDGLMALGINAIDSTVGVAYSEEEKEFTGDKGQVKFMDRTVKFFEDAGSAPVSSMAANEINSRPAAQNPVTSKDYLTESEQTPDEEVTVEDIPF